MAGRINQIGGVILMGMTAWFGFNLLTGRPLEYSAEDEYDCMVCGVVSEKEMTQDDELCDSCLKTHGRCGVCQDIELLTDLHYDSTGMMNLCGRCEKHDETFGAEGNRVCNICNEIKPTRAYKFPEFKGMYEPVQVVIRDYCDSCAHADGLTIPEASNPAESFAAEGDYEPSFDSLEERIEWMEFAVNDKFLHQYEDDYSNVVLDIEEWNENNGNNSKLSNLVKQYKNKTGWMDAESFAANPEGRPYCEPCAERGFNYYGVKTCGDCGYIQCERCFGDGEICKSCGDVECENCGDMESPDWIFTTPHGEFCVDCRNAWIEDPDAHKALYSAEGKMGEYAWVVIKEYTPRVGLQKNITTKKVEAVYLSTGEAKRGFNLSKGTYIGDWKDGAWEQEQRGYKQVPWGSLPMTITWDKVPIRRFGYDTLTHQKERTHDAESFSADEDWEAEEERYYLEREEYEAEGHHLMADGSGMMPPSMLWTEEDDDADEDAVTYFTETLISENFLAEYMADVSGSSKSRFLKASEVEDLFRKAKGTLVSVTFVKRTNGEVRKMLCRTSVKKGVKGVGLKFNPKNRNLIGVYDFQKVREGADPWKCYRFVPMDAVLSMRVRGQTYTA